MDIFRPAKKSICYRHYEVYGLDSVTNNTEKKRVFKKNIGLIRILNR